MADLRWLEDIRRLPDIQRSRRAMYKLIHAANLPTYEIPGDRRTYLDVEEVRRALKARPRSPRLRQRSSDGQPSGC